MLNNGEKKMLLNFFGLVKQKKPNDQKEINGWFYLYYRNKKEWIKFTFRKERTNKCGAFEATGVVNKTGKL